MEHLACFWVVAGDERGLGLVASRAGGSWVPAVRPACCLRSPGGVSGCGREPPGSPAGACFRTGCCTALAGLLHGWCVAFGGPGALWGGDCEGLCAGAGFGWSGGCCAGPGRGAARPAHPCFLRSGVGRARFCICPPGLCVTLRRSGLTPLAWPCRCLGCLLTGLVPVSVWPPGPRAVKSREVV